MSARRFYFTAAAAPVSPAFDAGWEQTGQAVRRALVAALKLSAIDALANSSTITVPITTTQDILCYQFVSEPLRAQTISGTVSLVIRALESATTANVNLAVVVKVVSSDGGTARGTLFSVFGTGTEFGTTAATRIVSASALTPVQIQDGDRLVVEIGAHAASPTAATSYTMRVGTSAASDFALTAALTTDLNPWIEVSNDVFSQLPNNYQSVKAGDGISVSERLR